jgi:TIR domain
MVHDVFISFASEDKPIADQVCAALETQSIRCWIAYRNNVAGTDWDQGIMHAITASRVVVLVCSSHADSSPHVKREVACAVSRDVRVLPFRIEATPLQALEYFLSTPHWLDASKPPLEQPLPPLVEAVHQLLSAAGKPLVSASDIPEPLADARAAVTIQVAILHKRHAQPDEQVLKWLETQLTAHGHRVFIDRYLAIGVEWAKEIERQVRGSDAVVPLLSAASVQSEMLSYEVETAHDAAQKQRGKP